MTHEEKINYMRMAAGMAGFGIKEEHLDLLVSLYEMVLEKQGDSTVRDALEIEKEAKNRADAKARSEKLDKFSEKTRETKTR